MLGDYEPQPTFVARMRSTDPENNKCIDCGDADPEWASMNNGVLNITRSVSFSVFVCQVFICFACSGHHRSLGSGIVIRGSDMTARWSGHIRVSFDLQ